MDHMTKYMEITDGEKCQFLTWDGSSMIQERERERSASKIPCLNPFSCGNSHTFLSSDAVHHLSPTLLEDKVLPTYFL